MSLKRIAILLGKELWQGPKNYIFTMAIVLPIVLSLAVTLVFGSLFSEKPKLGIVDEDGSGLVAAAQALDVVEAKEYRTTAELRAATEQGAVDIGVVFPPGFAGSIRQGQQIAITAYIWGESLAKNRVILGVAIVNLVRDLAGHEAPVEVVATTLGDDVAVPWSVRLFPMIVLMAVFMGGLLLPATSVVIEKEKETLQALVVTPASVEELFAAKGVLGIILSLFAGTVILLVNQAFGREPALLMLVLSLGAIMAAAIGLLLGAFLKDWTTLFTVWKTGAIVLFAPAFIYLFPQIPEWVAKLFPTYYLIQPIVDLSQHGAGWADIAGNVVILIGLNVALVAALALALKRVRQYAI